MKQVMPRPSIVTAVAGALTLASISATAAFLIGRYPALPVALPVHFRDGRPDVLTLKNYGVVLMPLWTQLILALVIGSIAVLLLYRAHSVPSTGLGTSPSTSDHLTQEEAAQDRDRMLHGAEAIALLGLVWISFQLITAYSLTEVWRRFEGGMGDVYHVSLLSAVVLSIVIGGRAAMRIGRPATRHADDTRLWRLKALYVNPSDPALFVPARSGYGLTLNFGRPIAIGIMLAILLVGLGGPFFLAFRLLRAW
jgi:uncharacterized membrane protein